MEYKTAKALEKLDARSTQRQGALELRACLEAGSLSSLLSALLKNLRRAPGVVASCETVSILAEAFETSPLECLPNAVKIVTAIVAQIGRGDARQRETCAAALGRIAAALSQFPPVEGGPAFGSVASLRLAVLFSPLVTALSAPNAAMQEGAAIAIVAVLERAADADVEVSIGSLLPRLTKSLAQSLAPQAACLALAAAIDRSPRPFTAASTPTAAAIVTAITKVLASSDHRARAAAARAAAALLEALSHDSNGEPPPASAALISPLRAALEALRYDRVAAVRSAVGEALAAMPAGVAPDRAPLRKPRVPRPGALPTRRLAASHEGIDVVLFKPPPGQLWEPPELPEAQDTTANATKAEAKSSSPLLIDPTTPHLPPAPRLVVGSGEAERRCSASTEEAAALGQGAALNVDLASASTLTQRRLVTDGSIDKENAQLASSHLLSPALKLEECVEECVAAAVTATAAAAAPAGSGSGSGSSATPAATAPPSEAPLLSPAQAQHAFEDLAARRLSALPADPPERFEESAAAVPPDFGEPEEAEEEATEVKENVSPLGAVAAASGELTPSHRPRVLRLLSEDTEAASADVADVEESSLSGAPGGAASGEGLPFDGEAGRPTEGAEAGDDLAEEVQAAVALAHPHLQLAPSRVWAEVDHQPALQLAPSEDFEVFRDGPALHKTSEQLVLALQERLDRAVSEIDALRAALFEERSLRQALERRHLLPSD